MFSGIGPPTRTWGIANIFLLLRKKHKKLDHPQICCQVCNQYFSYSYCIEKFNNGVRNYISNKKLVIYHQYWLPLYCCEKKTRQQQPKRKGVHFVLLFQIDTIHHGREDMPVVGKAGTPEQEALWPWPNCTYSQ